MVLPCGPVFFPAAPPVVRAVLHAARHVRSYVGHHVVHPVHHAVHAIGTNPATAAIGFACRTAPGWTAAGLLALPLLQPVRPVPAQPPTATPPEAQSLQVQDGSPLPARQSLGAGIAAEVSTSTTPAPSAALYLDPAPMDASAGAPQDPARMDANAVAPQAVASVIPAPGVPVPLSPPLPRFLATPPASTISRDKIPEIIAREFLTSPQAVPEPSSLLVLASGFYSLRWIRRRR